MIKTVSRLGNGHALPLDKSLMEQLGVTAGSKVQVVVSDGSLIVTPVESRATNAEVAEAMEWAHRQYGQAFKKLAE